MSILHCTVCHQTVSYSFPGRNDRLRRGWPTCCGRLMDRVEEPDRTCSECGSKLDAGGHCMGGCDE